MYLPENSCNFFERFAHTPDGERTLENGKYFKIILNYLPSMTATVTNAQHAPQSPCNFTRVTKFSSR